MTPPTDRQVETAARIHYQIEQDLAAKIGARKVADWEQLPDLLHDLKMAMMRRVLENFEATRDANAEEATEG